MTKNKHTKKGIRILQIILLTLSIIVLLPVSYITYKGYASYKEAISELPLEEYVDSIRNQPNYVAFDNISSDLLNATVAIEDRRFYDHNGIDLIGIGRAALNSLMAKEIVGGGSSITQQLAKNMYFPLDMTLERKVAEAFMARQIERTYEKEEILELYVNIINYGDNHMGIYEASQGYFQKAPYDLTLDEASLLAGLPQSPANFQLSNHLDSARIRQKQVLNAMLKENMITQEQANIIMNL